MIASGANDGQIQIWDQSRTVAPRIKIQNAHKPMTEISNVTFSYDNTCLSSRGGDGSVKIWDLRNTKKVLVERTDLPSMYHCTQETIQIRNWCIYGLTDQYRSVLEPSNDRPFELWFKFKYLSY